MSQQTSALGQKRTFAVDMPCPLYPRKRTCAVHLGMSAKCQQRTNALQQNAPVFVSLKCIVCICQRPNGRTPIGDVHFVSRRWLGVCDTRDRWPPPAMAAGVVMRQFQSTSDLPEIVHPTCAKCGAPMWLTRIEPDGPGLERRTFECQACQNEVIEVVKFR